MRCRQRRGHVLCGCRLRFPRRSYGVQAQGTEFEVSTTAADGVDVFFANFGHGCGTAQFEFTLFAVFCTAATCFAAFVPSFTCDSHSSCCLSLFFCLFYVTLLLQKP